MEDATKEIVYFIYCGEVNTAKTLRLARDRCEALGISTVVVASETGQSALLWSDWRDHRFRSLGDVPRIRSRG